jgi:hypothetical protein
MDGGQIPVEAAGVSARAPIGKRHSASASAIAIRVFLHPDFDLGTSGDCLAPSPKRQSGLVRVFENQLTDSIGVMIRGRRVRPRLDPADHGFGLQVLAPDPVVPLHSRSLRQSVCCVQIRVQVMPVPDTESQSDPSGHSARTPGIVQAAVQ